MKTIFFVQPSEAETARNMEKKLLGLPASSGILFVGVEVRPGPDGKKPIYIVFVGCKRERELSLMDAIVKRYLADEFVAESQLIVEARRGFDKSTISD